MNIGIFQYLVLFLLICLLIIYSCRGNDNANADQERLNTTNTINKIIYRFEDASVPPEYHRSYTITLMPEKLFIVVDSYGTMIAEKEFRIEKKQYDDIVSSLLKNNIRKQSLTAHDGCTGGTAETVSYWDEKEEIFSASLYHCGGIDSGNLGGNVKQFADDIKKLIPSLSDLLR